MDALAIVLKVIDVLEGIGVDYHVGGSFASSIHGFPRQTRDADLVSSLGLDRVDVLVAALRGEFYADDEMIRDAIRRRSSFNLIHLASGFKVDVFVPGDAPFDKEEISRAMEVEVQSDPARKAWVKSAEDTVLRKLQFGEVSERQWLDVLGVLKVQGARLDLVYLLEWSKELGVDDLLERAMLEAG